mmetsp:Transcript_2554/g.9811  ORF Transcript_2554/g.9811 Transcript_2554/m.9811 type:complete len:581 (-) Transcript_2554:482-2224(-)
MAPSRSRVAWGAVVLVAAVATADSSTAGRPHPQIRRRAEAVATAEAPRDETAQSWFSFLFRGADVEEEETPRRRLQQRNVYAGAKQKISDVDPVRLGISTALVMTLGALAAGAGIGGGGLFVPIFWLVLDVGPKAAVPLSTATILGGAIGNFVSIGWQKHPRANRPLIDYEAAVFTQPGELLGVVFGVLLNIILPKIAIVGLLALVLSYNSRRTIKKALRTYAKESAAFAEAEKEKTLAETAGGHAAPPGLPITGTAGGTDAELEGGKLVVASGASDDDSGTLKDIEMVSTRMHRANSSSQQERKENAEELKAAQDKKDDDELAGVLAMDAVQFPKWAYAILIPMTAYLVLYKLLSRTVFGPCARWDLTERDGEPKGYAQGIYWTWYWTPVPVFASFWIVVAKIIKGRSDRRRACAKYVPLENDLVWDEKFMKQFPAYALCAGCASGLLGIGGGMILGPIFMAVNMEPRCATSASAFSILWTAGSSTILWLFGGNLGWQLLVWQMGWGFVSGQLGQHMVDSVLKKTGRPSFVIFLLGAIIGTACVAMVTSGIVTISMEAARNKPIFYLDKREFRCGVDGN